MTPKGPVTVRATAHLRPATCRRPEPAFVERIVITREDAFRSFGEWADRLCPVLDAGLSAKAGFVEDLAGSASVEVTILGKRIPADTS